MDIDRVVEEIREQEEAKQAAAEQLRDTIADTDLPVDPFITEVASELPHAFTAAGVDGGLARQAFHGMDIILRRAVAAVFRYDDGELEAADYQPGRNPSPDIKYVGGGLARQEVDTLATLQRLEAEVDAALETVDDADLVLLDGSLLPQPGDRPAGESTLTDRYDRLMDRYRELYTQAEEAGTLVAGVVEDTRSSRLQRYLQAHGVDTERADGRDTVLLSYMLEQGERTAAVPYAPSSSRVVEDVGVDGFSLFYLRTAEKDRPVRIEFRAADGTGAAADAIASSILALCGEGRSYGIPPVLVEADQRAALSRNEVELVTKRIRTKLAHLSGTDELRRERRPF